MPVTLTGLVADAFPEDVNIRPDHRLPEAHGPLVAWKSPDRQNTDFLVEFGLRDRDGRLRWMTESGSRQWWARQ